MTDLHVVTIVVMALALLTLALKWLLGRSGGRMARTGDLFALDAKPYFFSAAENRFFTALLPAAQALDLVVFPKVRIADLVLERKGAVPADFEGSSPMVVDYLLVTRHDYRPVAGIDLASGSHPLEFPKTPYRTKAAVFEAVRLPLLRFTPQEGASDLELRTKLARALERDPILQTHG